MDDARLKDAVVALSARHAETGQPARAVLAESMRGSDLAPGQRRRVAQAFYRLLRLQRRVDHALHLACERPLVGRLRAGARVVASLVLDGALAAEAAPDLLAEPRSGIDWTKVAQVDAAIDREPDPVQRFGLRHSLPDWLAARFLAEFATEADAVMAGLNGPAPLTLRANTLRTDRDALLEALRALRLDATPTRFAPHGVQVEGDINLFASAPFRAGWCEQQDEASQLCAHLVAPPPGGRVLDACAGSGGKALALAAALHNRGEVLATDTNPGKLAELVERRRRAGTANLRSRDVGEDEWPTEVRAFAARADRILLDVPCDGIGAWRRRPDARWSLDPAHVDTLAARQRDLLRRALDCLQPGARVVYATCTIFRASNEAVVEGALHADPGLELVPIAEILGAAAAEPLADGKCLRLFPHRQGTDGFFAAVLRRRRRAVAGPRTP